MTSAGTLCKLRALIADIERGQADAPLRDPALAECLGAVLSDYTDNMSHWAMLSRLLEAIERSIEWNGAKRQWQLSTRRAEEYQAALAALQTYCAGRP